MMRRLQNLALFLRAYYSALFRRSSLHMSPKRVLVVPAGKLGDVIGTTPVVRALRKHLPHTKIYVRDNANINSELLADSGLADAYLEATDAERYIEELRSERIDTVLLTGPSLFDLAAALIAGTPNISAPTVVHGYSPQEVRTYRALLRFVSVFPYAADGYAPRERLRALEPLGIHESDTAKRLGYSERARTACEAFLIEHRLEQGRYVVLSPSAGNKIKAWPPERFARVAEHIAGKGIPVVVIGAKRDREEVEAMLKELQQPTRVIDASGRFSLDELKAVIARAALFISVDTGPLYIAEAFGVATIDIVGPVDERVQPPRGPRNIVLVPERRKAELSIMNARVYDEAEARRQTLDTTVEEVCGAVDALLEAVLPSSV